MKSFVKSLRRGYSVCIIASAATTAYVIHRIKRHLSNRARGAKTSAFSHKGRPSSAYNDRRIISPVSVDPKMGPRIEAEGSEPEADEPHVEAPHSNIETDVDCNRLMVNEVKDDLQTSTLCLYQKKPPIKTEDTDNLIEIIPDPDDSQSVSGYDSDNCDYDQDKSAGRNSDPDDFDNESWAGNSTDDDLTDDDLTEDVSTDDDSYDSTDSESTDDDSTDYLDNYHLSSYTQSKQVHTSDIFHKTQDNKITERAEEEVKKHEVKGQLPGKYKYDNDWQVEDCYYDDDDEDDDQPIAVATKQTTSEPKSQSQVAPPRTELEPVPVLHKEDFMDPLGGQTVLGRGAFGEVTLKYQQSTGRWVAYKSLFEGSRDDIISEAQVMQLLSNHPSFPIIYGVVIQDGHFVLVSEFLGDELTSRPLSLTDALQGERPLELSQGEWNDIARDIVDGVWYMHRCNLLHHDIKTDNILLVEGATRWEARIIDFGQCKQSKEQLVTPLDENITPREEMMAARLHWTTFSDVYGVGKILLLIGQHGNVPSVEEGGLSLKKSASLSIEPSDNDKYPQMEIVRFQLGIKSRKMLN